MLRSKRMRRAEKHNEDAPGAKPDRLVITLKEWAWNLPPTLEIPLRKLPELKQIRTCLRPYGPCFLSQPFSEATSFEGEDVKRLARSVVLRFTGKKADLQQITERLLRASDLVESVESPASRTTQAV